MQWIDRSFTDLLQKQFQCSGPGLLDKDCVNRNGDCIAVVLLEFMFLNTEQEACMLLLYEFFDMKPCLRKMCMATVL